MKLQSPDDIRQIAMGFQASRILLTAYELGLFTALGRRSRKSDDIAGILHTDPRATDRLMNALCAMGLLEKKRGKFSNSRAAERYLDQGEPEYLSNLMHTVHLWRTWSTLTESVRAGTAAGRTTGVNDRSDNWLESFIAAMHYRAVREAIDVVRKINLDGISRVLDVGGGSGAYAMAFVRAKKRITATVFDLPNVIPLAKRYVEEAGLTNKIDFTTGDYLNDELGIGYDLVLLSAIVHSNSDEENRLLIQKCARALNPNGRVVVQDFIMDDERTSPRHGALFALNMLVGTEKGDTYSETEIRSWMNAAGLKKIRRNKIPALAEQIIGIKR